MTSQNIAKFNLFELLNQSILIESKNNANIWFAHLNLSDSIEYDLPDSGQISDYFFSNIKFPDIKFFLLLIDRKRIEKWTGKKDFVFFQELIEYKIINNEVHKKIGCVWKECLDDNTLIELITHSPLTPLVSIANNRKASIIQTNLPFQSY